MCRRHVTQHTQRGGRDGFGRRRVGRRRVGSVACSPDVRHGATCTAATAPAIGLDGLTELAELLDQRSRLGAREPSRGLALVEPEGTACVPEVGMAGLLDERTQLLELARRCWWTGGLPECHGRSLADGCDTAPATGAAGSGR